MQRRNGNDFCFFPPQGARKAGDRNGTGMGFGQLFGPFSFFFARFSTHGLVILASIANLVDEPSGEHFQKTHSP